MVEKKVTVEQGDTLWSLAQEHLGDPKRHDELYSANKELLAKHTWLPVGAEIVIPSDEQGGE